VIGVAVTVDIRRPLLSLSFSLVPARNWNGIGAKSAPRNLPVPVDLDDHAVRPLDGDEVAVDLGEERATAARQQVVHVRVLDRMAGDDDRRAALDGVDVRPNGAGVVAQLRVAVLVVALEERRGRVDDDQRTGRAPPLLS
jgi:hypothetical protein